MRTAMSQMNPSAGAYHRILKLAQETSWSVTPDTALLEVFCFWFRP